MARPSTLTIDQSWTHLRISYCEDTTPTNDCPEYYAGDALNPSSISCGTLHPGPPPYYHYSNYKTIAEKDGSYWKLMNNGETYSVINGGQIRTNGKTGVTLNFDSSGGKLYFTSNDTITVNTTGSGIVHVEGNSGTINTTSASKFDLSAGSNITITGLVSGTNEITLNGNNRITTGSGNDHITVNGSSSTVMVIMS